MRRERQIQGRGTRPSGSGPPNARRLALAALQAVERGERANLVLPRLLGSSGLDGRDRALATELVYGTCRMRRACDWLVDSHVRGRVEPNVRAALRLGAYQIGWTRIPAHAAVSATVDEVAGPGRKLVNAVLRRVAADVERGLVTWPDRATELSYPDWIVDLLSTDLGREAAIGALEQMNEPAEVARRSDGYTQDPASQMVAEHLGALLEPGDGRAPRVVDICAAPGGKATALAGGASQPVVVAADLSADRILLVAENVATLGTERVLPLVADGTEPPLRPGHFDLVLVDAPCSGLGVLRRRPDARWRIRPDDVERLGVLQRLLLERALPLVRPGGVLAYSVCTMSGAETAAVDNWLARSAAQLTPIAPPGNPWRPAGRGAMLLPQTAGTDGMFLLTLRVPGVRSRATHNDAESVL